MVEEVGSGAARALQDVADKIAEARKILVVTGAGISTNCGIPDFRSKTGLYSLIEKDHASQSGPARAAKHIKGRDMFDVSVWNAPETAATFLRFIARLRQNITSHVKEPSTTHRFIKLLRDQRRLVRTYTQNIDGLEQRLGLRTDPEDGRGSRSRFTKKALALPPSPSNAVPGGALHGGCEAVQLHGDLDVLRCSVCQKLVAWDEHEASDALLHGTAPECPLCLEHDEVRRQAGQRGRPVGVLRPNVVLYGEEHPRADAIGSLVTSDIACCPDLLLIFGTSLKVHGLQKVVREFANAVHARKNGSGKVIFINNTPLAGSTWRGVIDTWVNMDCDSFVSRVRSLRADIWSRQVPLPFPIAKNGPVLAQKKADPQSQKENVFLLDSGAMEPKQTDTKKPTGSIRKIAQPSKPSKTAMKRRVLGEIATNNQAPCTQPAPHSGVKRKFGRSKGFEIYEEEPIVVSSSSPWALKGVLIPSSQSSDSQAAPPKRRKISS